jgi:hypothetical protein
LKSIIDTLKQNMASIPFPTFAKETAFHIHPLSPDERLVLGVLFGLLMLTFLVLAIYSRIHQGQIKKSKAGQKITLAEQRAKRRKHRRLVRRAKKGNRK